MPSEPETARPPYFVPRKATARAENGRDRPAALSEWREKSAYVLLGEPGAGKSEAFRAEADACNAVYISARNFAALTPRQDWATSTIFIDGLDEMRAGSSDMHAPLDVIRGKLDQLGRPRFRISCREADWLGAVDTDALKEVSNDRLTTELRLEPLDDTDILEVLNKCADRVVDATAFWDEAGRRQLQPLLRNPLLLQLMIDAVSGSSWPSSRAETFELACLRTLAEHNRTHATARSTIAVIDSEQSLNDAGLICAVLLLSGEIGVSVAPGVPAEGNVSIQRLTAVVTVEDAARVVASKLFVAIGDLRVPRHRALAEYLAGRAVSKRCTDGTLPVSRVLALTSGVDGAIVEPLRGFNAWLAALCPAVRDLPMECDPLGVILYGDVLQFSLASKRKLLLALKREAENFAWFRSGDWTAHPFGALGTRDMQVEFVRLIELPARDPVHYSVLDCVLDAILFGEELPLLAAPLIALVRDSTYPEHIRSSAIDALLVHAGATATAAVEILRDITAGIVRDDSDELTGKLLKALYSSSVSTNDILSYYHDDKAPHHMGAYKLFWSVYFLKATHDGALPDLADALALRFDEAAHRLPPTGLPGFIGELVCITIEKSGDRQSASSLYGWLGIGIDEYGGGRFDRDDAVRIGRWLTTHPAVLKDVFGYGLDQIQSGSERARAEILACHERLCGARPPPDWIPWLLTQAARAMNPQVAQYCVQLAAGGAMTQNLDTGASFEYVELWADANRNKWPEVASWIEDAWSVPIDHWTRDDWKRKAEATARAIERRQKRRSFVTEHFAAIAAGTAPPALLRDLAFCVEGPLQDIVGETPRERLREYLVGSDSEVLATLGGLQRALYREDLPTCEDIFNLAQAGQEHYLLIVCLVGAQLQYAAEPTAFLSWSEGLTRTMAAFWLTHGAGDEPAWYARLVRDKSELIAKVFHAHANVVMARGGAHTITGLWRMAQDGAPSAFANIVLPPLLEEFPLGAEGQALIALDGGLLPAAARSVRPETLADIAWRRLSQTTLNPVQRVSWLVFALTVSDPTRQQSALDSITATVLADGTFGAILASAIERQAISAQTIPPVPLNAIGSLIELLGPHVSPEFPMGAGLVTDANRHRDLVRGLITGLAASTHDDTASLIDRLRMLPQLTRWRTELDAAAHEQRRLRRMKFYQHADARHVAQALANAAPANARDLAALMLDELGSLQARIRGDEMNQLRLFRRDNAGKEEPKVENDCRDVLLVLLRERLLTKNVNLEKEGSAADDTRCDIRATTVLNGRRVTIPVEIKKDNHQKVWTAWKDQLQDLYTIDPSSGGIGIYLVLWFGDRTKLSPDGKRPSTATEMHEALGQCIPETDRHTIKIVVCDLTLPSDTSA